METPEFDLAGRQNYRLFTPVTIRFSDQDSMGHVNNVSFAAYIEAARTMLIQGILDRFRHAGLDFILARVAIDYLQELHYPGTVDVGARLIRIGGKSLTSGYGVFSGAVCVATAVSINVFYDMTARRSVAPPDDIRAAIDQEISGR
ncbi:MAG: thioesterase family protein [Proteobacteria bacterium]|nr:thioesterase family protein [Pseudomonadota bacterium]